MSKYFEKNLKKTFKRTLNNFRPKSRKGLGMGLGKGFKNMIPQDPFVHSMSARGVKTGEKISIVKTDMSDWKWNLRFIRHGLYAGDGKFFKTKKVAEKYARKYMKLNAKGISEEMLEKFGRLDGEFSPENLTCDGELSNLQVRKKYAMLMREWRALEKEIGHKISRNEVDDWMMERYRQREKAREDEEEQHKASLHHENTMREENKLDAKRYTETEEEAMRRVNPVYFKKAEKSNTEEEFFNKLFPDYKEKGLSESTFKTFSDFYKRVKRLEKANKK